MNAFRSLALCAALIACVAATPREDPTYSLIWKPTEGQAIDYTLSTEIIADDGTVEFVTDVHLKVSKVEADGGYTLETTRKNLRMVTAGQEEQIGDDDEENNVETERYNAHGDKISDDKKTDEEDEEDDGFGSLLKNVVDFDTPDKPVVTGQKWTREVKADEKKHIKAAKFDYEVLGESKTGDYKVVTISVKYRQTEGDKPANADGTISFDTKDMSMVMIDFNIKDAPLDEETKGKIHLKMVRK